MSALRQQQRPSSTFIDTTFTSSCSSDEIAEQRVRIPGTTLELGVRLGGNKPGMVRQLNHLDQTSVRGKARHNEPRIYDLLAVRIAHLVAVAMTFVHEFRLIRSIRFCA